jgi:predicted nucleic acid-binding protein/ribosomal protein S18 acetylase RimI-like enzyme
MPAIRILSKYKDVQPYLVELRKQADSERDALGFLPARAYEEAALQGKLLVAEHHDKSGSSYAGHLFFGGVFPYARVFQLFVAKYARKRGVAADLIAELKGRLKLEGFVSVTAKVASDLKIANIFWERAGFVVARTKRGGNTRNRTINLRVLELSVPGLLSLMQPLPGPTAAHLHLPPNYSLRASPYVIDLNVMFDVVKRRARQSEARALVNAAFAGIVRLAVTEEFITELQRSSVDPTNDPILELATCLQILKSPDTAQVEDISSRLAPVVFPERARKNALSVQDISDLHHIAIAIFHRAGGFVTSEKAVLRARNELRSQFGIDVLSLRELSGIVDVTSTPAIPSKATRTARQTTRIEELATSDSLDVQALLEPWNIDPERVRTLAVIARQDPSPRRIVAKVGGQIAAYATWPAVRAPRQPVDLVLCANESHTEIESAVDHLFCIAAADVSRVEPALIRLHTGRGQTSVRKIATEHGFRPPTGIAGDDLHKVAVGNPVVSDSWNEVRANLQRVADISLPKVMPALPNGDDISVTVGTDKSVSVPLIDLETLLAPVLFLFHNRNGAVIPIRRSFAEELFGATKQLSLIDAPQAVLLRERAYFGHPRMLKVVTPGMPILFYESSQNGGRSCVFAIARATRTDTLIKQLAKDEGMRRGVLDKKQLKMMTKAEATAVVHFDNIMLLRRPVPYSFLLQNNCVSGANLVTTQSVSSDQLKTIVREGLRT